MGITLFDCVQLRMSDATILDMSWDSHIVSPWRQNVMQLRRTPTHRSSLWTSLEGAPLSATMLYCFNSSDAACTEARQ